MPSIRTDVPPRAVQSIASNTDFGAGVGAAQLVQPTPYADHGVAEDDFAQPRPRAQLRDLFSRVGERLTDAEFDAVYQRVRCERISFTLRRVRCADAQLTHRFQAFVWFQVHLFCVLFPLPLCSLRRESLMHAGCRSIRPDPCR